MQWWRGRGRGAFWTLAAVAVAMLAGCGVGTNRQGPPTDPFRGVGLKVVVLGDPSMTEVLADRRGEWERSRGGSVTIEAADASPTDAPGLADLLVFPGDRLGSLVDVGAVRVLPEELDEASTPDGSTGTLDFDEIVEPYREQVTKYGGERVALPLLGSTPVLAFRRSAFDGDENHAGARAAGIDLSPPETWEELDALARFLDGRDWDGDGEPEAGIALALGPDPVAGVGNATLLARAAGGGLHRDYYSLLFDSTTMAPRVTEPPFVEALEALVGLADAGPEGMTGFDGEAARAAFRNGEAALLIDLAEYASGWLDPDSESEVGVARLPGSHRMYDPARDDWEEVDPPNRPAYLPRGGGWLVAVSAASESPAAAEDLARYLVGREVVSRLRADARLRGLPIRSPLIGSGPPGERPAPGLDSRDWSDAVSATMLADRVVVGLRIPGATAYLDELDDARAAAVSGRSTVAEALVELAEAWEVRTRKIGLDRQLWNYRRSLNALATDPEPPR